MYDEKYRLRHDTTVSISKSLYETWTYAENNIAAYLSHVEIPKEYLESGYRPRKAVVASFEFDSASISNIKILNDTSGYADAVKDCIKKAGRKIADELRKKSSLTTGKVYMGKYYVAFNFILMNFNQQLKNGKAIPIIRGTTPLMDVDKEKIGRAHV